MTFDSHIPNIRNILIANKLPPKAINPLIRHLGYLWVKRSPSFVVDTLKQRFSAMVSGDYKRFSLHGDGSWKGVWRPLWTLANHREGRKGLVRALRILKLGSLFTAPEPTIAEYIRLKRALEQRDDTNRKKPYPFYLNTTSEDKSRSGTGYLRSITFDSQYPLGTTTVPLKAGVTKASFYCLPLEHISALDDCPRLVSKHYDFIYTQVGSLLPDRSHFCDLIGTTRRDYGGRVTLLTKDRGMKLRPVVAVFSLLQQCCSRLHSVLQADLANNQDSYVFDQTGGAEWVQTQLFNGMSISSIDLTAASDNIPMGPILSFLRDLYPWLNDDIDFFADVQRLAYYTPYPDVYVRWLLGTIAGVKGGFGAFSRYLIGIVQNSHGKYSTGRSAHVGDDCAIHDSLTPYLLQVFLDLEIPVNLRKSIISNTSHGEFVGRVIDKQGSLHVYKASPYSDADPSGLVRQYGIRGLHSLGFSEKVRDMLLLSDKITKGEYGLFLNVLAYHSLNNDDALILADVTKPEFHVGGCPLHIYNDMKTRKPYQYPTLVMADHDRRSANEMCTSPGISIICWSFPFNTTLEVEIEQRVLRQYEKSDRAIFLDYVRYLNAHKPLRTVPNLADIELVIARKGRIAKQVPKGKHVSLPWSHIHRVYRACKRSLEAWKISLARF